MHRIPFLLCSVLIAAASTASASPAPSKVEVAPRTAITGFCGQNDLVYAADFILYNNLWGESTATSGSQCTYLDYDSGHTISWQTAWTWEGGSSNVKSYANAVLNVGATFLSSISSIPSTWTWKYGGPRN
jgi:xyloglucan-specific endo-beta-1,4-glucanase